MAWDITDFIRWATSQATVSGVNLKSSWIEKREVMESTRELRLAVVGVGRMGRHHARIYHELEGVQLAAVVDSNPAQRDAVASDFACAGYATLDELLEKNPRLDAVSIALPTVHHLEAAAKLLPRGVACLIEKPLAPSAADAAAIAALSSEHSVICQVGHTERFNPAMRAVAEMDIRPRFIEVDRVAPMSFRSIDVGVVFDLMIHDLDIVLMLCRSPLKEVHAVGVGVLSDKEDVANARLQFEDGCVANLTVSRLAMKTERKLRVFSEKVYVTLDFAQRSGMVVSTTENRASIEEVRAKLSHGEDLSDLDYLSLVKMQPLHMEEEEPLKAELQYFLSCVRDDRRPVIDAEAGRAAVDAAERVVQSLREHHWEGFEGTRLV